MSSEGKSLRLDDKVRSEDLLIEAMQHNEDKKITAFAMSSGSISFPREVNEL